MKITANGIGIRYELEGPAAAPVVVMSHSLAANVGMWEDQMPALAGFRVLRYDTRGHGGTDAPEGDYTLDQLAGDLFALLDALGIDRAHFVGLSMGGMVGQTAALRDPGRFLSLSLVVAGCGYGAERDRQEQFRTETEATASFIETASVAAFADRYAQGPTRVQFQNKDPRGWAEFREQLAEHSLRGSANTMRGVQSRRPSIYDLEDRMRALRTPTLILTGDEDDPCLTPNVFMKRTIPSAALITLPNAGHTINIEEPFLFNQAVDWFLGQVRSGRWPQRDTRSQTGSILGVPDDE